jgi:hypothetical protein
MDLDNYGQDLDHKTELGRIYGLIRTSYICTYIHSKYIHTHTCIHTHIYVQIHNIYMQTIIYVIIHVSYRLCIYV